MKPNASRKWICAALAALLVCVCAGACAQSYSLGDEADEIATIQTALTQLKLYSGDITGHYGEKTEAAVKLFQKKYALNADGVAGEDTIKELYEAAGIDEDAASQGSGSSTLLRRGSRSDAVRELQEDLTALGYYNGTVSGHYGSLTEAAVTNFQKKNGLTADGIAGAKTLEKIASLAKGSSSSSSSSSSGSSSSSSASSSLLKYGMTGSSAIRQMQTDLKELGYYTGSVTGNFGNLTKEAVYNFQKANGLSADGIAGEKTLSKIASKLSESSSSSSSGSSSSSSSSSTSSSSGSSSSSGKMTLNTSQTLLLNTKSDEVLKMQKMLYELGYYTGNRTGNFGEKTQEAVIAYQKAKGLTADGVAGKRTLSAINADYSRISSSSSGKPSATQVLNDNFYNWRRNYSNGEYCSVFDFETGYTWTLRIMTKDAHMDAEPATAQDTEIMNKAFGGKVTWTPKVVWVTFSDGKTYIGSTHNVPHTPYHLKDNNFDGHLCVHFPITMEKAKEIGPYATSHQEAILEGWEKTERMLR